MTTAQKVELLVDQHFATGESIDALIARGQERHWERVDTPIRHDTERPKGSRALIPDPQPNEEELEIILLLSQGETTEDLRAKYEIALGAMRTRIYRIRQLFGVDNNVELVATALRRGWIR